ncbi:hypothetical protein ABB37_02495 [Leptomonas pyrrhocoris]|uniref:CNH domain-containing protein n=1 Tax=Leptomonas pyrrhocoris TaxID=157538 RepID=A0A0N0DXD3_LEPPY|nr:hypothetical protein ABB37_02495 [Leptomonas pyrrhocoris]KPA82662.1 hypothetical protein ABB37_02495 [Leptomonas pyrrhocoris]|eukprot:XP_015661101.1 hypothetical protein ABB37_02495 [Leptomonas pyrrhocoris]
MPAVESLLQLYSLDEKDGTITAFDSYGSDVHLGTSTGKLIRLTISETCQGGEATSTEFFKPTTPPSPTTPAISTLAPREQQRRSSEASLRTIVSRRCTLSNSGAAVQQLQHSRSQRVLFALCEGRLLLLHAETYALLSSIATNIVSFSVAQPVRGSSTGAALHDGGFTPSVLASYPSHPSRPHPGWSTGTGGDDEVTSQQGRTVAHTRTSSEASHGSSLPWTPRSSAASPVGAPFAVARRKPSKAHVVCVAEKNNKELAVYLVDRVSTAVRGTATVLPLHGSTSPSLSTIDVASDGGGGGSSDTPRLSTRSAAQPPRVVLRQRFVLPEPAQRVVMCTPSPVVARVLTSGSNANTPRPGTTAASATVVEAGLTVCVGMRREVSLLPLLGGVPRCVLRLDGSRPPLLSIGSDPNTYLVRTQAPNTVMEVGVPPSAAAAGLRTGVAGDVHVEAAANPILLRMDYHRMAAGGKDVKGPLAASSKVQPGKEDELIVGDVFQSDGVVELVLGRFPFIFLFTAEHCDAVSLLSAGSSNSGDSTYSNTGSSSSSSSSAQRIPLPGIRHGALYGHGSSLFVASDRTVWSLQLYPLRAQLAEMVQAGRSNEAFQLLAFHQQRALSLLPSGTGLGDGEQLHLPRHPHPLALLEGDLHRMAGFVSLYKGDVAAAIDSFRGHLDPRELLLSVPDCIPPHALAFKPSRSISSATAASPDVEELPEPLPLTSAVSLSKTVGGGHVLHHVEAPLSAADVRSFLFSDSATTLAEQRDITAEGAVTNTGEPSVHVSYWDQWNGPCVYNSGTGDVSRAWRAAFDSHSLTSTPDAFAARCYEELKDELRRWFAAALLSPEAEALSARAGKEAAEESCGGPTATPRRDADDDGPLSLPTSVPAHADPPTHRRAMAHASLVLAWQARDFHTAYTIVARATTTGLCVEDCDDVLRYLREFRLLALLHFQVGDGAACECLLRNSVCLSTTLPLPPPAAAPSASLQRPDDVQFQLSQLRRCLGRKFEQGEAGGSSNLRSGWVDGARPQSSSPFSDEVAEALICGRGLLMQPSVAHVARVAHLLLGAPLGGAMNSTLAPRQAWEQLLDSIVACYASQVCPPSLTTGDAASFVQLHFTSSTNTRSGTIALPHAGPVLTTFVSPSFSVVPAVQRGSRKATPPLQDSSHGVVLHVLPSPLSEYFYAIEKLDVCVVRHLLTQQPRLAQARDVDGCTGLHLALAQVRVVTFAEERTPSGLQMHERARKAEGQSATLKVLCALVGLLVGFDCPASVLSCNGWSCLDVAAVACGGDETVFDIVSAALLASLEMRRSERENA